MATKKTKTEPVETPAIEVAVAAKPAKRTAKTKQTSVEFDVFTRQLGESIRVATIEAGENGETYEDQSGVTYEEGRGYRYRGSAVSFGDYLVTARGVTQVMSKADFDAKYETV